MRVVFFPAGTRGDFEPLLAFAVALKAAGHEPHIVCNPNYCAEADAFGVPNTALGLDTEVVLQGMRLRASHARTMYQFFRFGRSKVTALVDNPQEMARHADVDIVVGGSLVRSAATLAEYLRVPYVHVVYSPQMFPSRDYAPVIIPVGGLPSAVNRLLWAGYRALNRGVFAKPLNDKRSALGLSPIRDVQEYLYPRASFLAADPELAPVPPDVMLDRAPFGAFQLPVRVPLPDELERFLDAGPAPVSIGFGSVVDPEPEVTTAMFAEAAALAGVRLVLSRGWSKYGEGLQPNGSVFVAGSVPHELLFKRVAAVVHHGGAGTTAAAARAGKPQIIVPHWFDQFQWGKWAWDAGIATKPLVRTRLTAKRLAAALRATQDPAMRERAAALGAVLRQRDPLAAAVQALAEIVGEDKRRRASS